MTGLLVLSWTGAGSAFEWPLLSLQQPKVAKAAPQKQAARKKTRKPAVEKVEVRSPDSLEGQVFERLGEAARLGAGDAQRYAHIFAFQDAGDFKKANEVIPLLEDHRLMGYVLYQRYTSRKYKATYRELAGWMKLYADYPVAQDIHDIAGKRKPRKGAMALVPPKRPGRGMTGYHDDDSGQLAQPYVNHADDGMGAISQGRSVRGTLKGSWASGLAAWKGGRYEEAAGHFENVATAAQASAWVRSAGAYWAARSHLRNRQPQKVGLWLRRAAEYPRSFYGIIAVKALGMEHVRFNWDVPELTGRRAQVLASVPAGKRALALADAGRVDLAEQELRRINPGKDITLQQAMMSLAQKAGMPAFEMRLGSGLKDAGGKLYDAALYPDAPWQPEGGYAVDRALVHAFIRQESKFDAAASNKSSGAAGLMQMMPATARIMARAAGISFNKEQLHDPAVNMHLGQKYLEVLLQDKAVDNNLFKLAVAYNAGPGNLARWEKTVSYEDDPLLFIESIPVAETRIFVERVLANYWIYRLKYDQDAASLDKVAAGEWPVYVAQDDRRGPSFASASAPLAR